MKIPKDFIHKCKNLDIYKDSFPFNFFFVFVYFGLEILIFLIFLLIYITRSINKMLVSQFFFKILVIIAFILLILVYYSYALICFK